MRYDGRLTFEEWWEQLKLSHPGASDIFLKSLAATAWIASRENMRTRDLWRYD
jgi:hypothetical protein